MKMIYLKFLDAVESKRKLIVSFTKKAKTVLISDCQMKTSIIISTQQAGVFFLPRVNIFRGKS